MTLYKQIERFKIITLKLIEKLSKDIKDNNYYILSIILFIAFLTIISCLYLLNPYNIVILFPRLLLILSIFTICTLTLGVTILSSKDKTLQQEFRIQTIPILMNILYLFASFIGFSVLYYISKHVFFHESMKSFFLPIIMFILMLSIIYSIFFRDEKNSSYDLDDSNDDEEPIFKTILFYIPCLIVKLVDFIVKDVNNMPKTTNILLIILLIIFTIFYIFPYLRKLRSPYNQSLLLLKGPYPIENELLYISQNKLKEKIINNKPFFKRTLLQQNQKWKNALDKSDDSIIIMNDNEGFENNISMYNPELHRLDYNIMNEDILSILSPSEEKVIKNALQNDSSNFSRRLRELSERADIQTLYLEYLANHDNYHTIISNIHELNKNANDYIHQETSALVDAINRANHINDYNYHYAISFWIYFDSEILKENKTEPYADILEYAKTPSIYYNTNEKELVIEVNKCNTKKDCEREIMYRTNQVSYQKWNNIIINYDYGTLDVFINNNLVSTKQNVSPYIHSKSNFIQIGSNKNRAKNIAICNVHYYDIPLNLNQIKQIYMNKSNPCK